MGFISIQWTWNGYRQIIFFELEITSNIHFRNFDFAWKSNLSYVVKVIRGPDPEITDNY